jgi:hypothetical protein
MLGDESNHRILSRARMLLMMYDEDEKNENGEYLFVHQTIGMYIVSI